MTSLLCPINQAVDNTTVADVVDSKRKLITANVDERVDVVLTRMAEARVSAVPVLRSDGAPVGWLSYADIVRYLALVCTRPQASRVTSSSDLTTDDLTLVMRRSNQFNLHQIMDCDVINSEESAPWTTVTASQSMRLVLQLHGSQGLHRVAVSQGLGVVGSGTADSGSGDGGDDWNNVITQSDTLAWLAARVVDVAGATGVTEPLWGRTLHDSGAMRRHVFTLSPQHVTIDALIRLHEAGLSGAPLVDAEGTLVGNVSLSDVRGLHVEGSFPRLLQPLSEYLKGVRHEDHQGTSHLVWMRADTPLGTVVKRVAEQRVHRVYVVDDTNMKLVGMCTLSDLLAVVHQHVTPKQDAS